MGIRDGQLVLFYLFDIGELVDLAAAAARIGGPTTVATLSPKPATPGYVQYDKPPISFDGDVVGVARIEDFTVRCRVYEYGVLSIALSRPLSGAWPDLVAVGQRFIDNAEFEQRASVVCRSIVAHIEPAVVTPREPTLAEDYLAFVVHALDAPLSAERLLEAHGDEIAAMLRGERQPLSAQEREGILRHRLSYLADDVVVPTWNAAFIYDTPTGAAAALEIVEFANSQLLQFRYYDNRLDRELATIYAMLQRPRWYDQWIGSRYRRAAQQVHALFIDVTDVTDRTVNTLKFTGDVYAARLFTVVADRLGLATWKADVEGKLRTLDAIYRFAVEQSSMARGQLLELMVVLILVFELGMLLAGLAK